MGRKKRSTGHNFGHTIGRVSEPPQTSSKILGSRQGKTRRRCERTPRPSWPLSKVSIVSDEITRRNEEIAEALRDTDRSVASISAEFGLSQEMIRRIGREAGVKPRPQARVGRRKKLEFTDPASELHTRVGLYFAATRSRQRKSATEFASLLGISSLRLRSIEMGTYDGLTLLELDRICQACGVDVATVTGYQPRAA